MDPILSHCGDASHFQHIITALLRPAGKDNKVIINDVGSWPWLKGIYFLACATVWLNVDTAYTCDPQHFSSTWWLGDPVRLHVQTIKVFLQCLCCLFGFIIIQYSLWCTVLWISAKWTDMLEEKKHNQSSYSQWTIMTGPLIMNRMSENWPHVVSLRWVDSNYIWFSG